MAFILKNIFGDPNKKALKKHEPIIKKVGDFENVLSSLSDESLKAKTVELKSRLEKGETLDDISAEAFAVVREASKRVLYKLASVVHVIFSSSS